MASFNRRNMLKVGTAGIVSVTAADVSDGEEVQPTIKHEQPRVSPFLAFFGDAEKGDETLRRNIRELADYFHRALWAERRRKRRNRQGC